MTSETHFMRPGDLGACIRLSPSIIFLALLFIVSHTFPGDRGNCFAAQVDSPTKINSTDEHATNEGVTAIPTLSQGDLHALVIGISRYKNLAVPTLRAAANDAKALESFLQTQKDLYRDLNIELLTDEQATKAELEKYLSSMIRKAGKNDTIVLFLSGHGAVDPKQKGRFFFLTYDADPESLEATSLNMSDLMVLKEVASPRVVLIADACHSGGFSEWVTKSRSNPIKTFARDITSSAGRIVITSSRPDEYSIESRYRDNGVFTHWFLEGLKGAADKGGNGLVTINEAYNYAYQQTKIETNGAQHPQFLATVHGTLPFSITASFQGRIPTILELTTDPSAAEVIVGGLFKGGTNNDGTLSLKYLPVGRPIPVLIRKEGWIKHEVLPPVEFSEEKFHVVVPPVTLGPSVASLQMTTAPGDVVVKVDRKPAGQTNAKGKLTIDAVQVCVNHLIELEKPGFVKESINMAIPVSYQGKKAELEQVRLSKVPTERPIDRIQKDYASVKGPVKLRQKLMESVSDSDKKTLELNPGMDRWYLENYKLRARRPGYDYQLQQKIYLHEMYRDMFNREPRERTE